MQFVIKCLISGILVGLISEIAKRSSLFAAFVASLPITSILAFIWIYRETGNINQIISLSTSIAWVVLPSIVFFITFSLLLKSNLNFYSSLFFSMFIMVIIYVSYIALLAKFNIKL